MLNTRLTDWYILFAGAVTLDFGMAGYSKTDYQKFRVVFKFREPGYTLTSDEEILNIYRLGMAVTL
jgi:hypothetical protein